MIGYSKVCPKFTAEEEDKLKQKIMGISKKIDAVENGNRDFQEHCKAFR